MSLYARLEVPRGFVGQESAMITSFINGFWDTPGSDNLALASLSIGLEPMAPHANKESK